MNTLHSFVLGLLFLLANTALTAQQTTYYSTIASGDWENATTWLGGNIPQDNSNSVHITIETGHTVILNKALAFNNRLTIVVKGTLIIQGDFEVKNFLSIQVEQDGFFKIGGNLDFKNSNEGIHIDGVVSVDGDVKCGPRNDLATGSGTVYVGGSLDDNAKNLFKNMNVVNNPLPIDLLDFWLEPIKEGLRVGWLTASETNNAYFTILRSQDLRHWKSLGTLDGAGDSNRVRAYSFDDEEIPEGLWYYRLMQTDYDGKYELFAPKAIQVLPKGKLHIFRVSSKGGDLYVELANGNRSATFRVSTLQGVILGQVDVEAAEGVQQIQLPLKARGSGVLLFHLMNGSEQIGRKIWVY